MTYEPMQGISTIRHADTRPSAIPGTKTWMKEYSRDAPKSMAASKSEKSNFSAAA